MGQLSETQIKGIKPGPKEFFLNDGDNLFLRVRDTGKAWIYRYEKGGKTVKLGLGPYPAVTLAQARAKAYEANSLRADGQDLKEVRRQREEQARAAQLNTFERLARTWHASARKDREWSDGYAEKVIRHLEIHIFPWIGARPVEIIQPTEIVRCLHRIKERGNLETAQRVREAVQHVYQYAVDIGALEPARNFVNKNTGGLPPPRSRHFAAITDPEKLGKLLRDIRDYNGGFITRCALRLAPMMFQRPGQIRFADWEDISLDIGLWRCPPEKMKMREWQKRDRVKQIYRYYKHAGVKTEVMGASFRSVGQIVALAGCDLLTISPDLLAQLAASNAPVARALSPDADDSREAAHERPADDEAGFRYAFNEDAMSTEKLAEGIRGFAADARHLESLLQAI